jgi:septal ring factor EnvC (AmiA/AmiB activator)
MASVGEELGQVHRELRKAQQRIDCLEADIEEFKVEVRQRIGERRQGSTRVARSMEAFRRKLVEFLSRH